MREVAVKLYRPLVALWRSKTPGKRKSAGSPGGTHGGHGIEEVGDEGCSVLNGLLSLGQVGHRVTLDQSQRSFVQGHVFRNTPTHINTSLPKDTVMPL